MTRSAHAAPRGPCRPVEIPDVELLELRRLAVSWAHRWGIAADDAEDLAQEVLLRVVRSYASFRGESQLSSWTYRIARNVLKTHVRRSRLRAEAEARFGAQLGPRRSDPEDGILGALAARTLLRGWVRNGDLTPTELSLIAMTAVRGMRSPEAAAAVGCRPGTIRSRISRAIARMRRDAAA